MGVMLPKNIGLLFLLISASLLSSSFAGGQHPESAGNPVKAVGAFHEEAGMKENFKHDEKLMKEIHERLLKANMRDYGTYDPAPTMNKPPFKLIPN